MKNVTAKSVRCAISVDGDSGRVYRITDRTASAAA